MKRAVRAILRLAAVGFILFGGLELGLEVVRDRVRQARLSVWHCVLGAGLICLGVILFILSAKLAEWLADDFDE